MPREIELLPHWKHLETAAMSIENYATWQACSVPWWVGSPRPKGWIGTFKTWGPWKIGILPMVCQWWDPHCIFRPPVFPCFCGVIYSLLFSSLIVLQELPIEFLAIRFEGCKQSVVSQKPWCYGELPYFILKHLVHLLLVQNMSKSCSSVVHCSLIIHKHAHERLQSVDHVFSTRIPAPSGRPDLRTAESPAPPAIFPRPPSWWTPAQWPGHTKNRWQVSTHPRK